MQPLPEISGVAGVLQPQGSAWLQVKPGVPRSRHQGLGGKPKFSTNWSADVERKRPQSWIQGALAFLLESSAWTVFA